MDGFFEREKVSCFSSACTSHPYCCEDRNFVTPVLLVNCSQLVGILTVFLVPLMLSGSDGNIGGISQVSQYL